MPCRRTPRTLYDLCVERVIPMLEDFGNLGEWNDKKPLQVLDGRVAEDLLMHAYASTCIQRKVHFGSCVWRNEWKVFLTPKVQNIIVSWEKDILRHVNKKCRSVKKVMVIRRNDFNIDTLRWLPNFVVSLDFDGELFFHGRHNPVLDFKLIQPDGWIQDAEQTLKAFYVSRQKLEQPEVSQRSDVRLTELHLGTIHATSDDLRLLLTRIPDLRILRHYQLVTALYELHSEQWRNNETLPTYKLRNLDVDFSHVIRCRMSPKAVLSSDALQLAVILCPDSYDINVRFDCSTPHDVLLPIASLQCVRQLSVVCVSSGERSLLDFSDISPILQRHGAQNLKSLELKVIEELDVHTIVKYCSALERLVLSGCGNVSPETCPEFTCCRNNKPSLRSNMRLRKLQYIFFADGDDFSWDHAVPQCFWYATLGSGVREAIAGHRSKLEGIFLESPRISVTTAQELFPIPNTMNSSNEEVPVLFPSLRVFSACRYPELTVDHLRVICGVHTNVKDKKSILKYIRISDCEQFNTRHQAWLTNTFTECDSTRDVIVKIS